MSISYSTCARTLVIFGLSILTGYLAIAQSASITLRGRVTDPSNASIPNATVTLRRGQEVMKQTKTNELGQYSFTGLTSGKYTINVEMTGFSPFQIEDLEIDRDFTLDVPMTVALAAQEITVAEEQGKVSVDPNSNVGSLIIKGADLEALSDDPDQLQQDLQALAGPSVGPNGGQIFIDGFTGGRLPPKSSIREVRINQNPFSAEYDRLGFGRIEIFTKPGSDRFRGQILSMFSDNALNARNPFVSERPDYQSRLFVGSLAGPMTRKSSFSFDVEHRGVDENAIINARVLDSNLQPSALQEAVSTPQRRLNIVPRFDLQLNEKNTLVARYAYSGVTNESQGIGNFSLPSQAYDTRDREHTLQLTETAVLSSNAINETRVQFMRSAVNSYGDNSVAALQVLEAFTGGGAQVGRAENRSDRWEITNITSITAGTHTRKFGGRLRVVSLSDLSPQNFGGTFTFSGGTAPLLDASNQIVYGEDGLPVMTQIDSLERYRRTALFLAQGLTGAQIRALGGGASQFSIAGGNPLAKVNQTDVGLFFLDDWRIKPNFTLSYGIRYETQTNISDYTNFSPRLSIAWGIDGGRNRQTKTVLRAGFGIFYDRISESLTLQALRFNGETQQQYIVTNPDFYPNIPSLAELSSNLVPQALRRVDSSIRAPYIAQTAVGIDRQLPRNTSISVTYTFSRGLRMLRTRNINAPLADGTLPFGDVGNIYLYESSGQMRQQQLITNFNTRFSRRVSLFGFYMLNFAKGNTDGVGSFPANSYDLSSEYGSTMFDIRHRAFIGGSLNTFKGVTLNPFITASSGAPFNITTGRDNNGDTIFTDRPAFATDPTAPGVIVTPWGVFNPNPGPGDIIIPRNYGRGPAQFSVNLRISRTWGFGSRGESGPGRDWTPPGMAGGPRGPAGGPPPGAGGGRPGGPGGPPMVFGGDTGRRYNLTLALAVRNLFNRVNLSTPVGNLSSPLFGESTSLSGGFGPMGASAASNRRLDLQLRFSF